MPTTVYSLLYGHRIVDCLLISLEGMSEEAQEPCNKYNKKFRKGFSQKCDRDKNLNVFRRLLVS